MREYHKIPTVWQRDPATNYKTLIENAWATPELAYLDLCRWQCTEKVDGTNIRIMLSNEMQEGLRFGGKTDNAQLPPKLLAWMQEWFTMRRLRSVFHDGDFCLYGEGYGAGIQKGGKYRDDQRFVLFDVWAGPAPDGSHDGMWLKREAVEAIAKSLGIECVPVVMTTTSLWDAIDFVRSGTLRSHWGDFQPEGLVMRPMQELLDRRGNRIIAKIKAKDFR